MRFTEQQKFVYALVNTQNVGPVKARKVIDACADISGARAQLSRTEADGVAYNLANVDFNALEKRLLDAEVRYITMLDAEYPKRLLSYDDAPVALYCKGDVSLLQAECLGVVGTRYPTKYGIRATQDFVSELSKHFVIVSGMARGVDSCAHKTALENKKKTVAVLGCGPDVVYPPENYSLYRDICDYGLIVSEHPLKTPALAVHFPPRNRIIAGLSRGLLVTEAGQKSGTFITVEYALNQGKEVYCVPGSIYSEQSAGCNNGIKRHKTHLVTSPNDILEEFGLSKAKENKNSEIQLDVTEALVLGLLSENGELHFEELMEKSELNVPTLNSVTVKLEALGLITRQSNNFWSI